MQKNDDSLYEDGIDNPDSHPSHHRPKTTITIIED